MECVSSHTCKVRCCEGRKSGKNKVSKHYFPKNESVGVKWVVFCQNPLLGCMDYIDIVKKQLFVCNKHFEEKCYYKTGRGLCLKSNSYPTLHSPSSNVSEEVVDIDLGLSEVQKDLPAAESFEKTGEMQVSTSYEEDFEGSYPTLVEPNLLSPPPITSPERENVTRKRTISMLSGVSTDSECSPRKTLVEPNVLSPPLITTPKMENVTRKRTISLLSGVSPDGECSPRKKMLMKIIHSTRKENYKMKKMIRRHRRKINKVKNILHSSKWMKMTKELNRVQKLFIEMILKNNSKKNEGRRYSTEEKIIALSIYKTSPKAYRYLRKVLVALPCPSTLKLIVKNMTMTAGISEATKQRLQKMSSTFTSEKQKTMILMWDEIFLSLGLQYDLQTDKIVGFEDWGHRRTEEFANHALVFMLRSVETGDTLPISFNFCTGTTTSTQLQRCIKEAIKVVEDAGLNIVASVCDGAATNVSAIDNLIEDTKRIRGAEYVIRNGTYIIQKTEVVPLFDPPHLIKCLRNNMLNKDLEFDFKAGKPEGLRTFAEWNHLITAYEIDLYGNNRIRSMRRLTAQHIYPELINRMSVKLCNQVFSATVSSTLQALAGGATWTTTMGNKQLPIEARNTAQVFHFINKLSDSTNGDHESENSIFRRKLTEKSYHLNFFKEAYGEIRRMRFVDKITKKPVQRQPPSLINLARTLRGFSLIWEKLKEIGFQEISTRHFNQDPLENFFGLIRSQGGQNKKPTCYQFIGSYKALLINNLTRYSAVGTNCQADNGNFLLTWEKYFDFIPDEEVTNGDENLSQKKKKIKGTSNPLPEKSRIINSAAAVVQQLKDKMCCLSSCSECMKLFNSNSKIPSIIFNIHSDLSNLLQRIMVSIYSENNICATTMDYLKKELQLELFTCTLHKDNLINNFLTLSIVQYIRCTIAYLNCVLRGSYRFLNSEVKEKEKKRNVFLCKAIEKRDSCLKSKHTYSTLSRVDRLLPLEMEECTKDKSV